MAASAAGTEPPPALAAQIKTAPHTEFLTRPDDKVIAHFPRPSPRTFPRPSRLVLPVPFTP